MTSVSSSTEERPWLAQTRVLCPGVTSYPTLTDGLWAEPRNWTAFYTNTLYIIIIITTRSNPNTSG